MCKPDREGVRRAQRALPRPLSSLSPRCVGGTWGTGRGIVGKVGGVLTGGAEMRVGCGIHHESFRLSGLAVGKGDGGARGRADPQLFKLSEIVKVKSERSE